MFGRCLIILALSCSVALVPGCVVPREPVWLPDSSGFIYTTDKGRVVYFDVGKRESRTVIEAAEAVNEIASTRIPAISPDGRQVALVRVSSVGAGSVQLQVHELASGNLLHTKRLTLPANQRDHRPVPGSTSGALWSPCGKHVLFWYTRSNGLSCGHYIVDTGVVKIFDRISPVVELWAVRLSPMSDDGRGFLAWRRGIEPNEEAERRYLVFIEFGGRQHTLKETARLEELDRKSQQYFDRLADFDSPEMPLENHPFVPFPHGHWKQGVARIPILGGWLQIDTVNCSVDYKMDEELERQRDTAIRESLVYTAAVGPGKHFVHCRATGNRFTAHVELFDRESAKATPLGTIDMHWMLLAGGAVPQPVVASPDGRRVVVSCRTDGGTMQWTVIDQAGTVLATIPMPSSVYPHQR